MKTLEERFWEKVDKRGPDDCWEWKAARDKDGYGVIDNRKAHRVSWCIAFGGALGETKVLHECDNPPCCNPGHLFTGTALDNNRDRDAKGRGCFGERHPNAKLSQKMVRYLRRQSKYENRSAASLAEETGFSTTTVSRAISGRGWSSVSEPRQVGLRIGARHQNSKLTDADVREIRVRVAAGESRRVIAAAFKIAMSSVSGIVTRARRKYVE